MEIIEKAIQKNNELGLPFGPLLSSMNEDLENGKANDTEKVSYEFNQFALSYINDQCSAEVDQLAIQISEIGYNWSCCFWSEIKILCLYVNRLAELKMRSILAIEAMVAVDKKFSLLKEWAPPLINVTAKYLESIFDELEGEIK